MVELRLYTACARVRVFHFLSIKKLNLKCGKKGSKDIKLKKLVFKLIKINNKSY
jgi:hypothetical protein